MTRDRAIHEARRIRAALERNANDIHFDRIDWETFGRRNRALWDQAESDPRIQSMVLGLLRNDPNWQTRRTEP